MGLKTKVTAAAGVLALAGSVLTLAPARATTTVHSAFTLPGHSSVTVDSTSWCDNKGPHITLDTSAFVGGSALQITFENNVKGTKQLQVVGTQGLTLSDGSTTVTQPKQPSLGGAGGNPFIYIVSGLAEGQTATNPDGTQNGTWNYIGRCVQDGQIGNFNHGPFQSDFSVAAANDLSATALSCSNKGSTIGLGATDTAAPVSGELVFTNNFVDLNGVTPHIDDTNIAATWGFTLANGQSFHKGWNVNGAGGNPLVLSQVGTADSSGAFVDSLGAPLNTLGRCNKL